METGTVQRGTRWCEENHLGPGHQSDAQAVFGTMLSTRQKLCRVLHWPDTLGGDSEMFGPVETQIHPEMM